MIACHSLISLAALLLPPVATLFLSVVPVGDSRSGVLLRGSSSASTFDLSCCPFLFRDGDDELADHQGAGEILQLVTLAAEIKRPLSSGSGRLVVQNLPVSCSVYRVIPVLSAVSWHQPP
jgi:hypothetical protein